MKKTIFLSLAFVMSLSLLSCGGGGGDDEPTPTPTPTPNPPTPTQKGKFYTKQCDMPADMSEATVTLDGLSSAVTSTNHVGTASWVTAKLNTYSGGTPQVTVACQQNLETAVRSHDIIFIAGIDTLQLTVRQNIYDGGQTDLDNTSDIPSDQPAYSRQR